METIRWKKGVFACQYEFFKADRIFARLKSRLFSNRSEVEIKGKKYAIQAKGLLKRVATLKDPSNGEDIAQIKFNCWYPKAVIYYREKKLVWKYTSWKETRWALYDKTAPIAKFSGWEASGNIKLQENDAFLALIGLYISNYYWQTVIYLASFSVFLMGLLG